MSLVAVFIPILLMGGIVGRLFREFAVTLSVAIFVSMLISLTTTPMMCAYLLKPHDAERHGWIYRANERVFDWILARYEALARLGAPAPGRSRWRSRWSRWRATIYLYVLIPKGFFPQQDVGRLTGTIQADQDTSFQAMSRRVAQFVEVVKQDPAVETVVAYVGGGGGGSALNSARMNVNLKDRSVRNAERRSGDRASARQARAPARRHALPAGRSGSARRRPAVERAVSIHAAGRQRRASSTTGRRRSTTSCGRSPQLADVNSDQQTHGLRASLVIDREHRVAAGHHARR